MSTTLTRRHFLAATAAATTWTAAGASRVWGANDRIRLGIIGAGSRGSHLLRQALEVGGVEFVAVCDAWDRRRDEAAAACGGRPAKIADYRELLDRKDVDAVIVATCDHQHAMMAVEACRAGKDVYVEKPMTSQPMQGLAVVKAVRETGRVLQVGMQQRSMANFIEAKRKFFDTGAIGRVHMVRTIWNGNGGYLTPVPAGLEAKPPGLDWEACVRPLKPMPWDPKRYFNRFAYWDISTGGQTGGLFVHMVDVVHWYLGLTRPVSAVCQGGIYQYDDGRDTPDNVNAILEYPQKLTVTFEASLTDMLPQDSAIIVFLGTGGRLSIFRHGYRFLPAPGNDRADAETGGAASELPHMANWLESVRSRQQPNADVRAGHWSSMACHLANLAYRTRSRVTWKRQWEV